MDYLDYLHSHNYHELPAHLRKTISEDAYRAQQAVVQRLQPDDSSASQLPTALQEAFAAQQRRRPTLVRRAWVYAAAACGLLLFSLGGWWIGRVTGDEAKKALYASGLRHAEQQIDSLDRLLTQQPLVRIDTVLDTCYLYLNRNVIKYDTIYEQLPAPPALVQTVYDTIYLSSGESLPVAGSSSLRGRERLLDILRSTE